MRYPSYCIIEKVFQPSDVLFNKRAKSAGGEGIYFNLDEGSGCFFHGDDRPGASNGQRAIAAKKGKTRRRFLLE
jgi:hypothetical protein